MVTIVTGGARSGKSSYAENLYKDSLDVCYIATSLVADEEMKDRVEKHRESRPTEWRTFEGFRKLTRALGEEKNYLLDCLTVMTSNIMFDISKDQEKISPKMQKQIEDEIVGEILDLIEEVRARNYNLVMVTNEVGSSIVPEYHISRVFRDIQGRVNQRVAKVCDEAYLVALGYAVRLK